MASMDRETLTEAVGTGTMPSILGLAALGIAVITPLCAARAILGAGVAWLTRNSEQAATAVGEPGLVSSLAVHPDDISRAS